MRRYFNTEGRCKPDVHYMVSIEERLKQIKEQYVERGKYFVINRGRQYGKTTTLMELARYLRDDYIVLSMDFQEMSDANFKSEACFSIAFSKLFLKAYKRSGAGNGQQQTQPLNTFINLGENATLMELFDSLSQICETSEKPMVLIIDEVDSASNNQVFVNFLTMLRRYYLAREDMPLFCSVILAGVYDIKNLKLKMRPDEEHQYNSPWNVAAKFNVEMSFSAAWIAAMLEEYESDNHTGMDVQAVAQEIYDYTSGYPYLVSAICKLLDEEIPALEQFAGKENVWGREGIEEAVKSILDEKIPLFDSMIRQLNEYPDMKKMLYLILFQGDTISYNPDNKAINLSSMFGYTVNKDRKVQVANRIFEMRLYNYFLSEEEITSAIGNRAKMNKSQFIMGGKLDMRLILEKFVTYFTDIYGDNEEKFVEAYGRKFFLLYLKPIINGIGNYYIEAQTRDAKRTDVIVDYKGEQFIIELKIWHGEEYNQRGEAQIADYLDYYHRDKGYMLSFNFNKNKKIGIKEIKVGDKLLIEAVV